MSNDPLPRDAVVESLAIVQCDLDDESGEVIAATLEQALAEGALDAVGVPLVMKKGRPGVRIEVLCKPGDAARFEALLLRETATLGVRRLSVQRTALARREESIDLDGQSIRLKVALWNNAPLRAKPEFDDCRRAAEATGLPVREIVARARKAGRRRRGRSGPSDTD